MLGLEYYAGLGLLDTGLSPLHDQQHLLLFTFDLVRPVAEGDAEADGWELNVALGRGLTDATPAQWITKLIMGHAF